MKICENCKKEFPLYIVVDGIKRNLCKRKYCLECSPFMKKNTRKIENGKFLERPPKCSKCGETDPKNFYGNKKSTCSKCHNKDVVEKGKRNREFALSILGNKCASCGFDKYKCSLDIHHLDPKTKDKTFDSMRSWSLDRVKKEIQNCILLCRNCHQAYHSGHEIVF